MRINDAVPSEQQAQRDQSLDETAFANVSGLPSHPHDDTVPNHADPREKGLHRGKDHEV